MNVNEQITFHSGKSALCSCYSMAGKGLNQTLINDQSTNEKKHFSSKNGVLKMVKALGIVVLMLFSMLSYAQNTVQFNFSGADQDWVVPANVTCITIETWGAQGEDNILDATSGGNGGFATGTLNVTPGEVLNVHVGGIGNLGLGGFNGGGNGTPGGIRGAGGGASDVRQGGNSLNERVIVAGGGGGAGNIGRTGGAGGGTDGANGFDNGNNDGPGGTICDSGEGGTQFTGGASIDAEAGTFGQGGNSTNPNLVCSGGGGGWYGGGSGNGAGGGSGYIGGVDGGFTMAGIKTGNGLVIISYSALALDCPGNLIFNLGSGECSKVVNLDVEVEGSCGNAIVSSPSGHSTGNNEFPIGPTFVEFEATENGVTVSCSFTVTIVENVPDDNSLSCGDQINVSMDEDCQFYFTADYLLTGNDYHCYDDYETFVMECETCDPIPTSPIITSDYIGDTLVGKVCDPATGICCWGYIVPEDKGKPSICCVDFSMSCTGDTDPGSISGITKTYSYNDALPIFIPDADDLESGMVSFTIDVECDTLELLDLNVFLDITHPNLGDLTAFITSPDGFGPIPVALPANPTNMGIFNGRNAAGTWTIKIVDNVPGNAGWVNAAALEIEADYANPIALDNCDSDLTPTYTDVTTDPECGGDCYQTITRTWCVTDDSGNERCCEQIICLTRPSLDDLVCPPDYDGMDQPMLSCNGGFPTDQNGHPDPSYTGRPTLEGFEVDGFCMLYCIYEDDSIDVCEGSYIIVREWECFDWCEGTDTTCTQIIKVMDTEKPELTCPDDISLNADYDCTAGTTLPPPGLTDACSPTGKGYTAFLLGAGNLVYSGGNWILSDIPIGTSTVCYAAYDGCGNKDTCYFDVIVSDNTPPVVNCETWHTVGISGSPSWYNAIDFDDGSFDYCGPVTFEVKRFENPNCDYPEGQETAFGPKVPFFCCDIGDTVDVQLRVIDANGLINSCISHVTVQDNVAPTHINCPADIEVACTVDIDNPDNTGGEPTFFDNCTIDTVIVTTTNPQFNCGVNTLYRKWVAIDLYGNKDSCLQTITVVNYDPFDGNEDIDWPNHVIDPPLSCTASTDPDDLPVGSQRPIITSNDACDNVSIGDPEDLYFYPVDPETSDFCYKIKRTWEVIDWCFIDNTGNPAIYEYEQIIKIVDDQAPTFDCPADVGVLLGDPVVLTVTNFADNCSDPLDITVTYDIDQGNNGSFEITDQSGPDASGPSGPATNYPEGSNLVRFIITDGCYQSDTCEVEVLVTNGVSSFNVSGGIQNEEGADVEYVDVEVEGDNMNDVTTTGDDGTFSFNLQNNLNYAITPERDDNILNGVSTYDLVLISKHILQYELLSTPYKIIAADVNHSGTVSAIDLVELRKVILFISDEFPNNTSWRFVDAEFVFPNPTDPFATSFPEIFTINGLSEDEIADFVGVKIGDVNISAAPNDLIGSGDDRNADGELVFTLADQSLKAGETYEFNFEATDFDQVQGFQFTMSFDADAIEFNDVKAGELADISSANFGLHKLNEGIITASWNTLEDAQTLENGKVLFSFSFTALEDAQLSELIKINSRFTRAEAYNHSGLLDLSLQYVDESGTIAADQFELYQNQPNPFKDETVIGFYLPESGKAKFKVFDISGRVIKSIKGDYSKGYNEISLNRSELQSSGVLYYQLESAEHVASKKMVLLD